MNMIENTEVWERVWSWNSPNSTHWSQQAGKRRILCLWHGLAIDIFMATWCSDMATMHAFVFLNEFDAFGGWIFLIQLGGFCVQHHSIWRVNALLKLDSAWFCSDRTQEVTQVCLFIPFPSFSRLSILKFSRVLWSITDQEAPSWQGSFCLFHANTLISLLPNSLAQIGLDFWSFGSPEPKSQGLGFNGSVILTSRVIFRGGFDLLRP